jgi:mannose-6-phosphate isomerase-like protein (cupin superfamily)
MNPYKALNLPFRTREENFSRPWGGYVRIDESQTAEFIARYFPEEAAALLEVQSTLSPKLLFVEPGKRLSWQYHHRRAEIWTVVDGPVGIARSLTDAETPVESCAAGERIVFAAGERHRLVGLNKRGVVAELWRHLDPQHPSDEEDIVRLQDDFGR